MRISHEVTFKYTMKSKNHHKFLKIKNNLLRERKIRLNINDDQNVNALPGNQ